MKIEIKPPTFTPEQIHNMHVSLQRAGQAIREFGEAYKASVERALARRREAQVKPCPFCEKEGRA
jgi:CHAD domain-containing protein